MFAGGFCRPTSTSNQLRSFTHKGKAYLHVVSFKIGSTGMESLTAKKRKEGLWQSLLHNSSNMQQGQRVSVGIQGQQ